MQILWANNKELNQWASLKKTMQSRPKHVEQNDVDKYDKRRHNMNLKKKIFQSIYGQPEEVASEKEEEDNKESVKVEIPKASKATSTVTSANVKANNVGKIKKKKIKPETAADRRLKTFSINPKKFKNKIKYGNKNLKK